jgi:CRISPR system Cascade subunit CasE
MHAAVMSSFAAALETPTGGAPRILWRVDHNTPSRVLLYIVSPDKPDLTHIVEQAGWPTTATWETFAYGPFLDRIQTGGLWAFRLTANPVHSIRRKEGEPTKRTAHITVGYQLGWLLKQQERGGFSIVESAKDQPHVGDAVGHQVVVHDRRNLTFGKRGNGPAAKTPTSHDVTLVTATYDGHLQVADADKLRAVLTEGLGKAKAYGCGLMTLAPVT